QDPLIARAESHYIYDIEGRRYFDGMSGQGAVTLGYSHGEIIERIIEQLRAIAPNPSGWPVSLPMIEAARKIATLAPCGLTRTFSRVAGNDANRARGKDRAPVLEAQGAGIEVQGLPRRGGLPRLLAPHECGGGVSRAAAALRATSGGVRPRLAAVLLSLPI